VKRDAPQKSQTIFLKTKREKKERKTQARRDGRKNPTLRITAAKRQETREFSEI